MKKRLELLVNRISVLSGIPTIDTKKEGDNFLFLEYASHYGGYRLVLVNGSNGGQAGVFGESSITPRRNAKVMEAYLEGLNNGLQFVKEKTV